MDLWPDINHTEQRLGRRMAPYAARYSALLHHANEADGLDLQTLSNSSIIIMRKLSRTDYEDAIRYLRTLP